ncbi:hypothetical protein DERP_004023 [Dermatophagoides pteronyssinus]|uniref:Uncharacterized protein n=1 Tax=Dermatophagoides pteronyssinus TaxID=6956 RepID=A0ABQ8J815_DERPT|nr:hypothetical protein DERP_004023 [Dermatophagoides pteronyssinus]
MFNEDYDDDDEENKINLFSTILEIKFTELKKTKQRKQTIQINFPKFKIVKVCINSEKMML